MLVRDYIDDLSNGLDCRAARAVDAMSDDDDLSAIVDLAVELCAYGDNSVVEAVCVRVLSALAPEQRMCDYEHMVDCVIQMLLHSGSIRELIDMMRGFGYYTPTEHAKATAAGLFLDDEYKAYISPTYTTEDYRSYFAYSIEAGKYVACHECGDEVFFDSFDAALLHALGGAR